MSFNRFLLSVLSQRSALKKILSAKRHCLPSLICSIDDDCATQGCPDLVRQVIRAASIATELDLSESSELSDSRFYNIFPGEHYRFLAALVRACQAKEVVDIGTYTGMSSRVFLDASPITKVTTYDVIPWDKFQSHLSEADFRSGRLRQKISDLSDSAEFERNRDQLSSADIIFCDAPKDGKFEYKFLCHLSESSMTQKPRLLVLDDIHFLNMKEAWSVIRSPKFDATCFAHWSGTGVVDISNGLELLPGSDPN